MKIENLVFEGGGVKGIAYAGALHALEQQDALKNVKNVAGTSAGSIAATLIAAGYNAHDVMNIWNNTDLSKFKDDNFGIIRDLYRLITNYGYHKGDYFQNWLKRLLINKGYDPDVSIKDFNKKSKYQLNVIVSDITNNKSICINSKNEELNNISVVLATRMSMSIPLFYKAIKHNNVFYCDGAVFNNFPIKIFDSEDGLANTLGFRLGDKSKTVKIRESKSVLQYTANIITCMYDQIQEMHLNDNDWKRTVWIDCGNISPIDFNLEPNEIRYLISQGMKHTEMFFENTVNPFST